MTANAMYIGNVPEVFLIADRIAEKERMAERSKIKTRKPRIIPMPTIEGNKGVEGPLHVSQEYKEQLYKQKAETKKKEKRDYERELLECLGKRERLQFKLSKLDPKKKKDNKKIISINFRIQDLDEKIKYLQQESGINLNKEGDSKLGRIWKRVKSTFSNACKAVKKFWKKHSEAIEGVLAVVLPIIGAAIFKKFLGV